MKTNTRFIQSIVKSAKAKDVILPWSRGKRRCEFIASRSADVKARKLGIA
ncbi:MAG: hypothetical protein KUG62_04600 [Rhodobacteraceae bacterium]|nr:hypothetical protein [Paracoccaceae bacterium]